MQGSPRKALLCRRKLNIIPNKLEFPSHHVSEITAPGVISARCSKPEKSWLLIAGPRFGKWMILAKKVRYKFHMQTYGLRIYRLTTLMAV